jgi:hypothetical protein
MKRRRLCLLAVLIAALAWAPKARAEMIFSATLTEGQVSPVPSLSPAVGFGTFTLNDAMTMLSFDITFSGLTGPATVLHFHDAPLGVFGPIVRNFSLAGLGTSGEVTGAWSSTDAQPLSPALVNELLAGNIYVDIHSTAFPGEPQPEIRGQLTAVPEPSTLTLLGLGALGLLGYRWRGRKRAA